MQNSSSLASKLRVEFEVTDRGHEAQCRSDPVPVWQLRKPPISQPPDKILKVPLGTLLQGYKLSACKIILFLYHYNSIREIIFSFLIFKGFLSLFGLSISFPRNSFAPTMWLAMRWWTSCLESQTMRRWWTVERSNIMDFSSHKQRSKSQTWKNKKRNQNKHTE